MNFGENLKLLRKSYKMSQEVLAEKLGVSRQSVSKWEVGSAYPEMSNITALCSIFHCNINDLINENTIDVNFFDEETKEKIVKFKKNQQRNMKAISKIIYIMSRIAEIIVGMVAVLIFIFNSIFLFSCNSFSTEKDTLKMFNVSISLGDDTEEMSFVESNNDLLIKAKGIINNHDKEFVFLSIEYAIMCVQFLSFIAFFILKNLYKMYKNFYTNETPFTLENERILKKIVFLFTTELLLPNFFCLIYTISTKVYIETEWNIKDIIVLFIALSIIYLFKYGRLIQVDSKSIIYETNEK